jgi:hypothetical protein
MFGFLASESERCLHDLSRGRCVVVVDAWVCVRERGEDRLVELEVVAQKNVVSRNSGVVLGQAVPVSSYLAARSATGWSGRFRREGQISRPG